MNPSKSQSVCKTLLGNGGDARIEFVKNSGHQVRWAVGPDWLLHLVGCCTRLPLLVSIRPFAAADDTASCDPFVPSHPCVAIRLSSAPLRILRTLPTR